MMFNILEASGVHVENWHGANIVQKRLVRVFYY